MKKIYLLYLFGSCLLNVLHAQESSVEKLFRANQAYESGKFNEAAGIAKECAKKDHAKSERWQAFRLLTLIHLAANEYSDARRSAEQMLGINPKYTPSKLNDPVEFVNILKSIKIIPKFTLGLAATIGGNLTFIDLTGTYNGAQYRKSYTSKGSWQLGLVVGYNWNEIISFHSGIVASSNRYDIHYQPGNWNINLQEDMTYLNVPLFARFTTQQGKSHFRFFADAGAFAGFLASATTGISRVNTATSEEKKELNLDATKRKNNLQYGLLYGLGVMRKIGSLNLVFDVRYSFSYANITNESNRYKNSSLFYGYYYIDDDLRLNNLSASLSIIYNINYKVIKTK